MLEKLFKTVEHRRCLNIMNQTNQENAIKEDNNTIIGNNGTDIEP